MYYPREMKEYVILRLGKIHFYPREMKAYTHTMNCTQTFIAALCVTAKI